MFIGTLLIIHGQILADQMFGKRPLQVFQIISVAPPHVAVYYTTVLAGGAGKRLSEFNYTMGRVDFVGYINRESSDTSIEITRRYTVQVSPACFSCTSHYADVVIPYVE